MTIGKADILSSARKHFDLELGRREESGDETAAVHRLVMPWNSDRLGPELTGGRQLLAVDAAAISSGKRRYFTAQGAPIRWIENPDDLRARYFECLRDATGRAWSVLEDALNAAWDVAAVSPGREDSVPARRQFIDTLDEGLDTVLNSPDPWLDFTLRVGAEKAAEATEVEWVKAFECGRILVFLRETDGYCLRPPHCWSSGPPIPCPGFADMQRRHAMMRARRLEARLRAQAQRRLLGRTVVLEDIALPMCQASPLSYQLASLRSGIEKLGEFVFLLSGELRGVLDPSGDNAESSTDEQTNRIHLAPDPVDAPVQQLQPSPADRLGGSIRPKRGRPPYSTTDDPLVRDIAGRFRKREFTTVWDAVEHAFAQERSRFAGNGTEENLKARIRKKVGKELKNLDDIGLIADPIFSI